MSSSMSNFLEAYAAVHNNEVKENFYSKRDELSNIEFGILSDDQLQDISEGILLDVLQAGFSIDGAETIFNEVIREAKAQFVSESMTPRHLKIQRIKRSFSESLRVAKQKAKSGVRESFEKYIQLKEQRKHMTQFQGSAFGVESRNKSAQYQIESKNAIALLTPALYEMVERAIDTLIEKKESKKEKGEKDGHAVALYKDQWKDRDIADYDETHGKKKRAKEMRADAGEDRKRMKELDPKWKHAKYSTGEKKGKKSVEEDYLPEEGADTLKDSSMSAGGIDGNKRYPGGPSTGSQPKKKTALDALKMVAARNPGTQMRTRGMGEAYAAVYESKKADKDYDGDGEVESGTDEWKGSRNNAIKKAIKNAMMDKGNPAKEEEKLRKSNKLFGAPMKEEKKQGYNDRLDDSLGSKHGKKSQSMKDRRDESEAMEKKEGKRKYSSDKQMDKDDDVCESTLSAKAGRAGKDLGKPGKNFQKIAAKAGKRYGSSEAGERVAGAILAKMRKANEEFDFDNTYGFLMSRGLTEEQTLWAIANYPELL